jgi:hypothetical protein
MRIYEDGIYRDATAEELAEIERMKAEHPEPEPVPTAEERIAALEEQLAAAKILLGVE